MAKSVIDRIEYLVLLVAEFAQMEKNKRKALR